MALKYTRDGLAQVVANRVQKRHHDILEELGVDLVTDSTCSECTRDNLLPEHSREECTFMRDLYRRKCLCQTGHRKCPNNICSRFCELIMLDHLQRSPNWSNTDPSRWCSDYWEYAKCFIWSKKSEVHSAEDCELRGLLQIVRNNRRILPDREWALQVDHMALEMYLYVYERITHPAIFTVADWQLERFIHVMIDALHGIGGTDVSGAVLKLKKLKGQHLEYFEPSDRKYMVLIEIELKKNQIVEAVKSKPTDIFYKEKEEKKSGKREDITAICRQSEKDVAEIGQRLIQANTGPMANITVIRYCVLKLLDKLRDIDIDSIGVPVTKEKDYDVCDTSEHFVDLQAKSLLKTDEDLSSESSYGDSFSQVLKGQHLEDLDFKRSDMKYKALAEIEIMKKQVVEAMKSKTMDIFDIEMEAKKSGKREDKSASFRHAKPEKDVEKLTEIGQRLIQANTGSIADITEIRDCVLKLLDKFRGVQDYDVCDTSDLFSYLQGKNLYETDEDLSSESSYGDFDSQMPYVDTSFKEDFASSERKYPTVFDKSTKYSDEGLMSKTDHGKHFSTEDKSTQYSDEGLMSKTDYGKHFSTEGDSRMLMDTDKSKKHSEDGSMVKSNNEKHFSTEDLHDTDDTKNSRSRAGGDLLNSTELSKLCSKEGRTSPNLKRECDKICAFIKAESEEIVHVWAAYKAEDETNITFVVFTKTDIRLDLEPWPFLVTRTVNTYNDESKRAMYSKENTQLSLESSRRITDVIDKYSAELMQKHTYLSAISASSVVSKNYDTRYYEIKAEPCIVLYVLAKNFIPINEEKFPAMLDGIPVDVREGGVQFCGKTAEEFHDNVRMGCKITSSYQPGKYGTLGAFVEHPEYGLCGLTCAHVILDDKQRLEVKEKGSVVGKVFGHCDIHQPLISPQNRIGKVVEVKYKEGGEAKPGIDIALFTIEYRPPKDGHFPDQISPTNIKYESGKVLGKEGLSSYPTDVQKFGFVTGLTHGQIHFDNAVVKELSFHNELEADALRFTTTLYKQYHVKSNDENLRFSELGDSGALVFIKDSIGQENDFRCIGIVEGVLNDNTCAVTPITAILEELKVTSLKSFIPYITREQLDRRFQEMERHLQNVIATEVSRAVTNTARQNSPQ